VADAGINLDSPRKVRRGADRSDGFFTAFNIVSLYCVAFYYAWTNAPSKKINSSLGLAFDKDPVKNFMISPEVYIGLPLLYLVAVWSISRMMKNHSSKSDFLRTWVQPIYNIVQIVVCAYMAWGLWSQVDIVGGNPFGLNTKRDAGIEYFVYIHYLTKYLDWCDTFFMILKKNMHQVSFLQVFHHATIGMVWGFLLNEGWGSGTAAYGAFINSVTHVIMYSHYFWTSFGFNNPFKRYITSFQLAQFASCILHAGMVFLYEQIYPSDLGYLQIAYHCIMLYLFGFQLNWAPVWCTGSAEEEDRKIK